ncbi:hypothetical protein [Rhodohalobacter sp.]|uniref:hypothetical protein n=1 Tax=Rhodohalobacter sp. TaxID=1974210 RepID=UPI002ACE4DEC|nr:hypothetical protein [Rhodohalobacter sp.]MDZ7758314.1 hypothetical protein [Rhodohalobacter sp.]
MEVGEQTLFPQLRDLDGEYEICSEGFSCRHQIADGVGKKAKHPAVIMWEAIHTNISDVFKLIQVKDCPNTESHSLLMSDSRCLLDKQNPAVLRAVSLIIVKYSLMN